MFESSHEPEAASGDTNETFDEPMSEQSAPTNDVGDDVSESLEHWKDLALRKAAEVDNIRRRSQAEMDRMAQYASEHILLHLLPIIDDLHAAVDSAKSSRDVDSLIQGLEMIYTKAMKVLGERGVHAIDTPPGEQFNVDYHEALMQMPSTDFDEGQIVQVVQRGYALHDKVLRHAKVITSSGSSV